MGVFLGLYSVGAATVGEQCSNDFEKVATCLNYATGKVEAPTKECCASVTEIKDSDPVCLCYIIQQTHDGGEQVKSLGIQEARLLQLPTACKLTNASASNCPSKMHHSPLSLSLSLSLSLMIKHLFQPASLEI